MTLDERMNQLEDQLKKMKEVMNHNNSVHRTVVNDMRAKIQELQTKVNQLSVRNSTGDVFGDLFKR